MNAELIERLARLRGIGDAYHDYRGELHFFSLQSKIDLLKAMGWQPRSPAASLPARLILKTGELSSTRGPTLNPAFSDWMMGWPPGWTEPLRPVTEWSRWLQLSHGAC